MSQRAPQATPPVAGQVGRGGPMAGMMGGPPQKSKDFKGSLRRLLRAVGEERKTLYAVFVLISAAVTIGSLGPKILGHATNDIFYGFEMMTLDELNQVQPWRFDYLSVCEARPVIHSIS